MTVVSPASRRSLSLWLRLGIIATASFAIGAGLGSFVAGIHQIAGPLHKGTGSLSSAGSGQLVLAANGRPQLVPLPPMQETWNCEVVVIGGTLGGIAAASHAMQSGATTCLIELTPWLGGQISSQGVSAIDESHTTWTEQSFSQSWLSFKNLLKQQPVQLPEWAGLPGIQQVADLNSCWVGRLCFLPRAGARAAVQLLQTAEKRAPGSRWSAATAFKGAEFDASGKQITAVYAVRRKPRQADYVPVGRFSKELASWYSWGGDETFDKIPLRLQPPPGKRMIVIDATDTGEFVGWAGVPHRLGAESLATTGERNASKQDNSDCTQAFTYPFVLAIHDDRGKSLKSLATVKPDYSQEEHQRDFDMEGFPVFAGRSFFNYRRIVSTTRNDPFQSIPASGDMTIVNWNRGNDWKWMNPPLLLNEVQLQETKQHENWMGGISTIALRHAEHHSLLFARWLLQHKAEPEFPLTFLSGSKAPLGTASGLSMVPYIREGRRIVGRRAYGQREFAIREADFRRDLPGRDFSKTAVGVTHYAIDIHGCHYRNWEPSGEAGSAPAEEFDVRPTQIPLESLIPQGVDNLLMGGKSIAVTHIANAVTRIHYSEWSIGAAAGTTAGWLVRAQPKLLPADIIPQRQMPALQSYLTQQGLRLDW